MTLKEIEELIDDTRRLPRAADKVALATALGVLEVARELKVLNEKLAASTTHVNNAVARNLAGEKAKKAKAGKR